MPLALQCLCFAALNDLVGRAEKVSQQEARISEALDIANQLVSEYAILWSNVISSNARGEPAMDAAHYWKSVSPLLDRLKLVVPEHDEAQQIVAETEKLASEQFHILEQFSGAPRSSESSVAMIQVLLVPQVMKVSKRLKSINLRLAENRERLLKIRNSEAFLQKRIKEQISFAVGAEICLTIVLILLFLRNISNRIDILVKNARRLPQALPLTETIRGSDEIAYLDSVLHGAAEDLKKAAEHRSMLMQMVAHDLRSPLMAANLTVDSLIDASVAPNENEGKRLTDLRNTLKQLYFFVEDLLTVDKLEAGKLELDMQAIPVQPLISDVVAGLRLQSEQNGMNIVVETSPLLIAADRERLMQVLNNLVGNAIKYAPTGSNIRVTARKEEDGVKFSIFDEGNPISEEDKQKLFDKFQRGQSHKDVTGFGVGLSICRLVVDAHGGQIGVNSSDSLPGNEFWFFIPFDEPHAA